MKFNVQIPRVAKLLIGRLRSSLIGQGVYIERVFHFLINKSINYPEGKIFPTRIQLNKKQSLP
jgi:hypothetical protein